MCIGITIKTDEPVSVRVEKQFGDASTLYVAAKRGNFRQKHCDEFNVSDLPGGKACACGLLGEGASWGGETWDLNPLTLPLLVETLRRFGRLCQTGFTLVTSWSKEAPGSTIEVRIAEMLRIVSENRIATRVAYRVR